MFNLFKKLKKEFAIDFRQNYVKAFDKRIKKNNNTEIKHIENFSVHCLYVMPNEFAFGMEIEGNVYYLMIFEYGEHLEKLWNFLENVIKFGYGECFYDIEGFSSQCLLAVQAERDTMRVVYEAPYCFEKKVENNLVIMSLKNAAPPLLFDIEVNKNKFVYEFYKELFVMFYNKELSAYHDDGTAIIKESPFLRGYFGDLSDEEIVKSVNVETKEIKQDRLSELGRGYGLAHIIARNEYIAYYNSKH